MSPFSFCFYTNYRDIDLNGDGIVERVYFIEAYGDAVYICINNKCIMEYSYSYGIVDIDKSDHFKEIIAENPLDLYSRIYYYDGNKIIKMAELPGIQENFKVNGSGIIEARTQGNILHAWFYTKKYRLNRSHQLEPIEEDLYPMNSSVKVVKELPLYKSRDDLSIGAVLRPGEEAVILSSDNKQWCLIENSKGERGWFKIKDYSLVENINEDAFKVFEGLICGE